MFDSPPLLLTTEASVLANTWEQIAFVVNTDNTPSEAVTEALEHIGENKIIGMILNKAPTCVAAICSGWVPFTDMDTDTDTDTGMVMGRTGDARI
ncbi:MAG: hypothetical protein R3E50_16065 [Halioglobus sp.]